MYSLSIRGQIHRAAFGGSEPSKFLSPAFSTWCIGTLVRQNASGTGSAARRLLQNNKEIKYLNTWLLFSEFIISWLDSFCEPNLCNSTIHLWQRLDLRKTKTEMKEWNVYYLAAERVITSELALCSKLQVVVKLL